MGSGPASHLAACRTPGAVIMMSPFTSIKDVVHDKVNILSLLLHEHFTNLENMSKVGPLTKVLLIHGKKDTLISYSHSVKLKKALPKNVKSELVAPEHMTHNEFEFFTDFLRPVFQFFLKYKIETIPSYRMPFITIPPVFCTNYYFEKQLKLMDLSFPEPLPSMAQKPLTFKDRQHLRHTARSE